MTDDQSGLGDQSNAKDARVQVLTAEVRTLVVGCRQVTLSVAKQLDEVAQEDIQPFGRIRTGMRWPFAAMDLIEVIGSSRYGGSLVRSKEVRERYRCGNPGGTGRLSIHGPRLSGRGAASMSPQ